MTRPDLAEQAHELVEARKVTEELTAEVSRLAVESAFKDAVTEAKARAAFLRPFVVPHLRAQLVDGVRRVVVLGDNGVPRLSTETLGPMTVRELLAEMRESDDYKGAFGERAPVHQDEHPAGKPVVITRAEAKVAARYQEAKALARKLGVAIEYAEDQEPSVPAGAVVLSAKDRRDHGKYMAAKAEAKERGVELYVQPDPSAP